MTMRDHVLAAAIAKAKNSKPLEPVDLESFCRLFEIKSKRELEKYARSLVVHKSDFASLILACSATGEPYRHYRHHREYIPPHLGLTEQDRKAMATAKLGMMPDNVAKAFRKVTQTFKDRRLLSGHLFVSPATHEWHFFYFDQRDMDILEPHWDGGAHIHFVNHHWPGYSAESIWTTFTGAKPNIKGALHLRYLDWRREEEDGPYRPRNSKHREG